MARAIPPWLHRMLIRDHGPSDPFVKLVLFTVNAFMDSSGSCFPGQAAIASAAVMGVSTVRSKIREANLGHWLSLHHRAAYEGQKWKQYAYRACCPDSIDLAAITFKNDDQGKVTTAAELADSWESVHGGVFSENLTGTMFPQPGKNRRAPPGAGGIKAKAPPATGGCPKDKPRTKPQAPPADAPSTASSSAKHRQLTLKAPPAAGYEVPILSSNSKYQREGALSRTPDVSKTLSALRQAKDIRSRGAGSPMVAEGDPEVQRKRKAAADIVAKAENS
jgi:hypothetical protein